MIKIMQYGEGNFLRTFVDTYFHTLNKEGMNYEVSIIKPIEYGSLEKFHEQNNVYHIILRGMKDGKQREDVYEIESVKNAIDPFKEYDEYVSLAYDKELKLIVSNTTEAGICFNENDDFNGFSSITYPAKLTKFLYERYKKGLDGLYILPVELIDNNADELYNCVNKYIDLWNLGTEFKTWNDENNYYCNTLVDRIVSGYPKDEDTKSHLTELIGKEDKLMSIGEPFGLWAIENKGEIKKYIKEGTHNIDVVLTNDIKYYKKRKVRVLNGSHTNLVPIALWHNAVTVYDAMNDERLKGFLDATLKDEIIPFVSDDIDATTSFASSVIERFENPFLNHQLSSIALNSISKWKARCLPSFKDYYEKYNRIPMNMVKGFAYLMATYKTMTKENDTYYVNLPNRKIEWKDDREYLDYFVNSGCVIKFMAREDVWGEDLTQYTGFAETVKSYFKRIKAGEDIL